MPDLLTDNEMKRLEKKINENQNINDKVGVKYKDYKYYIERIKNILPDLIKYCRINKNDISI